MLEDAFVLCSGDTIEAVGRMRDVPALDSDVRRGRLSWTLRGPRPRRLPHACRLRRRSRRRVLAPSRWRELRAAARGGRRHPLDRSRDARGRGGGSARGRRAAPLVDAPRGHDDVRGEVGLWARPRDGARVAARDPRGGRHPDVARCARGPAGVRRRRRLPRFRARRSAAGSGRARGGGRRVPRARGLRRRAGAPVPRGVRRSRPRAAAPRRPVHRVRRRPARGRAACPLGRPSRGDR